MFCKEILNCRKLKNLKRKHQGSVVHKPMTISHIPERLTNVSTFYIVILRQHDFL